MVRMREESASTGRITRLRDEDIEIVEPSTTKLPGKRTKACGSKRKQPAKKEQTTQPEERQTIVPSVEQTTEQSAKEQQTAKPSTRRSLRKRTYAAPASPKGES